MRLKPGMGNLRTIRTDGDINLYQTMNLCFKQPNHLLCWVNVKENIEKAFKIRKKENIG